MSQEILIVDDEIDICRLISQTLEDEGYHTRYALNGPQALEAIQDRCPHVVLVDIWLGNSQFDGLKLLECVQSRHPSLPILMMSGHGTIETAVQAIKMGAYDFIEKPFKADRLLLAIQRTTETARLRRENSELKAKSPDVPHITGTSSLIQQLRHLIDRVAPTNGRVLISGPSGSGKEILARVIHQKSKRKNASFVVLNCATLDPHCFESVLLGSEEKDQKRIGLFEQAHLGTLFLDEVTDMPFETQGKILHFLHEQTFTRVGGTRKIEADVRVIASTSRDITKAVNEKRFRQDLYYRLNVFPMNIPSLKERPEDIPLLVDELASTVSACNGFPPKKFSDEALLALQTYDWPGNIRQLKNVIEWILIMYADREGDILETDCLPSEMSKESSAILQDQEKASLISLPLREARESFEKDYLQAQVLRFGGNISKTAEFVGMERSTLHRKINKFKKYNQS